MNTIKKIYQMRFPVIFIVFLFLSCQDNRKEKETQMKELQLELKAKDLELQQKNMELRERSFRDSIDLMNELNTQKKSLSDLYDENKKSVFLIVAGNNYERSSGSGFFIREDGLAVSNYHLFKNADEAIIYTDDREKFMINEIVDYSEEEDYIIFKISNTRNERFRPVAIATENPRIGEECFAIGNPQGLLQTLSKGIVSNLGENVIQTTAQITFGSSGGALFNEKGEVMGITSGGRGAADLNYAINLVGANYVRRFLNNDSISFEASTSMSQNDTQNIKRVLERYFDYLNDKDFNQVSRMYAYELARCYNYINLSRNRVMEEHYKYYKTYPYQKSEIDYNSITMTKDYDGNININFKMDFTIGKPSWNQPKTFKNDMFMSFDNQYKIIAIYNNIIK